MNLLPEPMNCFLFCYHSLMVAPAAPTPAEQETRAKQLAWLLHLSNVVDIKSQDPAYNMLVGRMALDVDTRRSILNVCQAIDEQAQKQQPKAA